MIIGGYNNRNGTFKKQTYIINMTNNTYTTGPDLLTARGYFACHTMNVNGEDFIIVAGGEYLNNRITEYLQKANFESGWKKSKNGTVV